LIATTIDTNGIITMFRDGSANITISQSAISGYTDAYENVLINISENNLLGGNIEFYYGGNIEILSNTVMQ
jgi:hypothetical protein